ncbi:hypothetical protein [Elioraea sp.]|uniref:hypothetical protein n=1 Tax=Elioraea sp. TaxID=2185103 RepID=UPI0021DDAE3D|nr:hypothetical protein [Elioraea sp.]GIX12039.1 MAG: hypothetical protein KatS3mg116_3749 [Elioraea sp.]
MRRRVERLSADAVGVSGTALGVRLWLELRGQRGRTEVAVLLDEAETEALREALVTATALSRSLADPGRVGHA